MLTLVIGNKNYSSWSLRPFLVLRTFGVQFDEVRILLDTPHFQQDVVKWAPNLRVPALHDDGLVIWDSLAICEYVNEQYLDGRGWPSDVAARAQARSAAAEMHSGFMALRNECGMNLHRPVGAIELSADARANVARIQEIWTECRERNGTLGPFLFGAFGAADAMFAPVVHRFRTYAIPVTPKAAAYMETMMALPAFAEWTRAGLAETLVIEKFETV